MLIKQEQDGATYAIVTGYLCNLQCRTTKNGKQYASFAIKYESKPNELEDGKWDACLIRVVAWSNLAEYMQNFVDLNGKPNLLVAGKLKVNEYNGKEREQLDADFIIAQHDILPQGVKKQNAKKSDDDFDDLEI